MAGRAIDQRIGLRAFLLFLVLSVESLAQSPSLTGLVQASAVNADAKTSFINSGTGALRFDESGVQLQQLVMNLDADLSDALSIRVTGNYQSDGDFSAGATQAFIRWKPLSNSALRVRGRGGFFYPRMSEENSDIGWLSPYTYTPSAINSWFGEELRVLGVEGSVFSPGRARRSPWSWEATGAVFGGNDPLGTLIAWRGFATHDRQSLHQDRVQFAPIPSVIDPNSIASPSWVEPFHEIDNRLGAYVGFHLRYRNMADLRLYRYDNNADDLAINSQRLYAWETDFTSLALRYDLVPGTRVLAQAMNGSSSMGDGFVGIEFQAYSLMVSKRAGRARLSVRYDHWDVDEVDDFPADPNDSDGYAWTAALRFDVTQQWQIGMEYIHNRNHAENRSLLGAPPGVTQKQLLGVLQYRF